MLSYCITQADGVGLGLVSYDSLELVFVEDIFIAKATEEFNIAFDLLLYAKNWKDERSCTTTVCAQNNKSLTVVDRERYTSHGEDPSHLPFTSLNLQSLDILDIFAIDVTSL